MSPVTRQGDSLALQDENSTPLPQAINIVEHPLGLQGKQE